jgi:hypothetical protein
MSTSDVDEIERFCGNSLITMTGICLSSSEVTTPVWACSCAASSSQAAESAPSGPRRWSMFDGHYCRAASADSHWLNTRSVGRDGVSIPVILCQGGGKEVQLT